METPDVRPAPSRPDRHGTPALHDLVGRAVGLIASLRDLDPSEKTTMNLSMKDRVAVVTGANKDVGFHIAEQIVKSGLFGTVIMACRDAGRGQAAAKQVGGIYMPLEVGNTASTHAFAEAVKSNFGRVDCLVNNAVEVGLCFWERK